MTAVVVTLFTLGVGALAFIGSQYGFAYLFGKVARAALWAGARRSLREGWRRHQRRGSGGG